MFLYTFADPPVLGNMSNKFYTRLLKPYIPNDKIHLLERIAYRPSPLEEDRWEVEKVFEFRSRHKTGEPEYKVQWKA